MHSHQLTVQKTAHYYTIGKPTAITKHIIIALHGYGQLASQIIYKFENMGDDVFIIAPEGLSRFYWDQLTQHNVVGASWMTKADRLVEIEDYCRYLNQLYDMYVPQCSTDVQIHVLGFSQGGATAVRWACQATPKINSLILWGSAFPTDLKYESVLSYLKNVRTFLVYGDKDEFISPKQIEQHHAFTQSQGLEYETLVFDGKHELNREILHDLVLRLKG